MEYGCIGKTLSHSFSKQIHGLLSDYEYELMEISPEQLSSFFEKKDFKAINVTIPYKEKVIPYLDQISDEARSIGAVNTIVNKNGKLYGYNTDFYGLLKLSEFKGIDFLNRKVLILGTGGTSRTAEAVAKHCGARTVIKASRESKDGAFCYEEIYRAHTDSEIIINTTPVGMFPNTSDKPLKLSLFKNLKGVIDAIYNPIRTKLVIEGEDMGIPCCGGLFMLIAQAVRASEIFTGKRYDNGECERIYKRLLNDKTNIVLIGMPSCGKSTVGKLISDKLCRKYFDTDAVIESSSGMAIPKIFKEFSEAYFRELEEAAIKEVAANNGAVIATGGGAVLRSTNVEALKQNGRIYFLDRPLDELTPTVDRPTASTSAAIKQCYENRYPIYKKSADVIIDAAQSIEQVADAILKDFNDFI